MGLKSPIPSELGQPLTGFETLLGVHNLFLAQYVIRIEMICHSKNVKIRYGTKTLFVAGDFVIDCLIVLLLPAKWQEI
ncbi:hypothetical protein Barb4_02712 [Bacteroidales bacterium Barb4]|nr:hypothetical protein Barb4_02712 [Bacteroidales bacterium Barb4]